MGENPTSREPGVARMAEGLLYVEVECPPELEVEFHAWYNLEHIPERLRIPGFVTGHRYAALEGGARWLAVYRLESPAVLESPEYRHWMGPRMTPWTKRMVSSTRVRRSVFRRAHHIGEGDCAGVNGLLAIRYGCSAPESQRLHAWHDQLFWGELTRIAGVLGAERFEDTETSDHLVLYHLNDPWLTQQPQFASAWATGWERQRSGLADWKRTLYIRIR